MDWTSLFTKEQDITAEDTRRLLKKYSPGSFQLLDVRQPKEYDEAHIPGAILMPLGNLPERLVELNPHRETVVYCRSGVRSRSACQILTASGFSRVLNMSGGILAWHGHRALGSEVLGLEFFARGDFASAVAMAYSMEQGLRRFYQLLADNADSDENRELLHYMATLEDGHMARLNALHPGMNGNEAASPDLTEGGFDTAELFAFYGDQLQDIESIIHTGMMFEAQAYDLYSRLSRTEQQPEMREFYRQMAGEEQRHLDRLARELDQRLN